MTGDAIPSPESQFDEIAFLYDQLMSGVPYREWASYLKRTLKLYRHRPKTMLDLCCGTGTVSLLLASEGYQVSGVDISPKMIERATQKAQAMGIQADFHAQDASAFRLGRKFDLVFSLFDSLNYILEASALQQAFYRVSEHLNPRGLFIFDVNTEVALAGRLFDQSNLSARAPVNYNWWSTYDPDTRICTIHMDFVYRRASEQKKLRIEHYQRAYDLPEIEQMLTTAGLQPLDTYDAYSFRRATSQSDRVFFVARK
ncbi:MAG TPA: class I SAM-dependent methyltransferase [Armatimonadota bacterium]|nr:class I SAM-dependent methyltransferase [Armatimonadota bacterium]